MILVDTSVWIDHLRRADAELIVSLEGTMVVVHPLVIGELACGNLKNRATILDLLRRLPSAIEATHDEVLTFIERHGLMLMGRGIGYIDALLLASTALGGDTRLWTRDRRLGRVARSLDLSYSVP
jgi:predicted nucleic acid-binding protein